jgi:hypothetical protein
MIDPECSICKNIKYLPLNLDCSHSFCFLCIKKLILSGEKKCSICNKIFNIDINNIKIENLELLENLLDYDTLWCYSTIYGNYWWLYDLNSSKKLDKIYIDYLKRNENKNKNENKEDIKIIIDSNSIDNHNPPFNNNCYEILSPNNNMTTNNVDYSCINNNEEDDEEDEEDDFDYTITICNEQYLIDFDNFKQININNSSKRRNIKRFEFDKNLIDYNFLEDLKNQKIIGISGIKIE